MNKQKTGRSRKSTSKVKNENPFKVLSPLEDGEIGIEYEKLVNDTPNAEAVAEIVGANETSKKIFRRLWAHADSASLRILSLDEIQKRVEVLLHGDNVINEDTDVKVLLQISELLESKKVNLSTTINRFVGLMAGLSKLEQSNTLLLADKNKKAVKIVEKSPETEEALHVLEGKMEVEEMEEDDGD